MQNNNRTFESQCSLLEPAELFFENGDLDASLLLGGSVRSFNTTLAFPFCASGPWQDNIQGNSVQNIACGSHCPTVAHSEPYLVDQICPYAESQLYSSSSGDLEGCYTHEILGPNVDSPQDTLYTVRSAFVNYNRSAAYNANGSDQRLPFKISNVNLPQRCLKFLRTINTTRSCSSAVAPEKAVATRSRASHFQDRAAFDHMIAERNRRVKLRQHFSHLRSMLPKPCKRDKYSILSNTTSHLNELKRRIEELERRNSSLESYALTMKSQSQEEPFMSIGSTITSSAGSAGSQLYKCQEVIIELSNTGIPDQVQIRINARNPVSTLTNSMINLLQCLREFKLEVTSIQSDIRESQFQADLRLRTQEGRWDSSRWIKIGDAVKRAVCL